MTRTIFMICAVSVLVLAGTPQASAQTCGGAAPLADRAKRDDPTPSCGGAASVQMSGSARLLSDDGVSEIPFERVFDYIVVPVSVDGSEPLRLVLDTGMPFHGAVLHPNPRTNAIELVNRAGVNVMVGGHEDYSPRVGTGVTLTLPGVELSDQLVTVLPSPGGGCGIDPLNTDGVIGLSIFDNFVVSIDYESNVLTLAEPGSFSYTGHGQAIPIRLGATPMPEVTIEVENEGGVRIPVGLVVDTGAMYPMSLTLGTNDRLKLPAGAREMVKGFSSWGEVSGKLGRVDAVRIGGYSLDDVLVTYFEKGAPGVPPCGENGILGNELLSRFNVTFHYTDKLMYLEPNSRFGESFESGMAGFTSKREEDGTRMVVAIYPDTPASESGLEKGDRILTIDGVSVTKIDEAEFRRLLARRGEDITLGISRGDADIRIRLTLRRLV